MGQADDLRAELEQQRGAFRSAIEAAADRWDSAPADEEWAPRRIAEHTIGADVRFANRVAQAIQSREIELKTTEFETAAAALAALDQTAESTARVYRYVEDRDLAKAAELNVGRFPATIEGVLQLAAYHFGDHAKQISAAG